MKCSWAPITAQEITTLFATVAAVMVWQFSRSSKMVSFLHTMSLSSIFTLRWRHQAIDFLQENALTVKLRMDNLGDSPFLATLLLGQLAINHF